MIRSTAIAMLFVVIFCIFSSPVLSTSSSVHVDIVDKFIDCLTTHCSKSNPSSSSISKAIYTPQNATFISILQAYIKNSRFNRSTTPKPLAIVTALDYSHVQSTVTCAKSNGLQIRIRSGGHDFEGRSYVSDQPFVVLDMYNLRKVELDLKKRTAWVESGAILGELYYEVAMKSNNTLAFPSGVCVTVGIGGHFTGGGYGTMMRKFGLSIDNVLDAQIVDSNGRILNRATMGEDLFWAIKGGGAASFCVILSWKIKLVRVPQTVTVFQVLRTTEEGATDIMDEWQRKAHLVDPNLFIRAQPQPIRGTKTVGVSFIALYLGSAKKTFSIVSKNFPLMGVMLEDCIEMSWARSLLFWTPGALKDAPLEVMKNRPLSLPTEYLKFKSDYVQTPIPKEGWEKLWKKMIQLGPDHLMQFNPYGGRMSQIPETATAFPHRAGTMFMFSYISFWGSPSLEVEKEALRRPRELYNTMTPYVSRHPREAFLNYRDLDLGNNANGNIGFALAYFKEKNIKRLLHVKAKVDPSNFFRYEQSIPLRGGHPK